MGTYECFVIFSFAVYVCFQYKVDVNSLREDRFFDKTGTSMCSKARGKGVKRHCKWEYNKTYKLE